ncbi:choline transporter-like protein 1 [Rhynchophorus ferrugineus]|uniref:choline transporter-like protein 1 n=1 Tax=Rhynchophorus ferrugineus TaxID=354439 RepID=UPI003FCE9870
MFQSTQSIVPNIPVPTQKRRVTNLIWLFVLGGTVVISLTLLIYCLVNIKESKFMEDSCGNICSSCSGVNMTDKRYVQSDGNTRECVAHCEDWSENDCIEGINVAKSSQTELKQALGSYINSIKGQIVFSALITILISMFLLMLLRHAAGCLVWSLILVSLATVLGGVVASWIYSIETEQPELTYANIFLTIVALCLCLLVYFWSSKISLLIMLINEAGKFIFDIPTLMALPVVVFLLLFFLTAAFYIIGIEFSIYASEKGVHPKIYNTVSMNLITFTGVFSGFTIFWVGTFLAGINVMAISGTVSHWYFNRNNYLRHPLKASIVNTFRYHLGNIALGSLIYVPMLLLKALIMALSRRIKRLLCCNYLKVLERLVRLFIRNSYILTGIYGDPFLESGRKAINILIKNLENVLSIYFIGNYVFALIQIMTIVVIMAFSAAIAAIAPPEGVPSAIYVFYVSSGIIAFLGSSITLSVVRVAVDTLLICYLEDSKINREYSKPLHASINMQEFMEKSKAI